MNPRMRNYMDRRMDGRNPYGSRGGYITSRRPASRDRAWEDMRHNGGYYEGEFRGNTGHDYGYDMNDYNDYNDYRDYRSYDYASGMLDEREIDEWMMKLERSMDSSERDSMSKQKILKRAKDMGMKFENCTEEEFAVTVMMLYTDYCKTLGKSDPEIYIKLAKDFLNDKDAGVKYGEKLAAYYDNIVNV